MAAKWIVDLFAQTEKCYYCERAFDFGVPEKNAGKKTLDHIIPRGKGGKHWIKNVVVCCDWCNNQKGDKTLDEFYSHIEQLKETLPHNIKVFIDIELIQFNIRHLKWVIKPYKRYLFLDMPNGVKDGVFTPSGYPIGYANKDSNYKKAKPKKSNDKKPNVTYRKEVPTIHQLLNEPEQNFHYE